MDVIHFYRTVDPFGCFSNFSAHPIFVDGQSWKTGEHYFQAQKFASPEARYHIRKAETPMRAAQLGRDRDNPLRTDWDAIKDDVMGSVVRLKVEQHADVREALTSTGGSPIVEHTANDSYWADGGDGSGRNMLGVILMEVRAELAAGRLDGASSGRAFDRRHRGGRGR
jgi:N-glycosidase YbiA